MSGRVAIGELLEVTKKVKFAIQSDLTIDEISKEAKSCGFKGIYESGKELWQAGVISLSSLAKSIMILSCNVNAT